jgi:hypothetical protein
MQEFTYYIKPSKPIGLMAVAIFFGFCALVLLISPYRNLTLELTSVFMFSMAIFFIIIVDWSYMKLKFCNECIQVNGFFGLRNFRFQLESICGYELHQRVDDLNGLHSILVLVLSNEVRIPFSKIAYSNYRELEQYFEKHFMFLGNRPLRYAQFYRKTVPIISLISGILALLVALNKFFSS